MDETYYPFCFNQGIVSQGPTNRRDQEETGDGKDKKPNPTFQLKMTTESEGGNQTYPQINIDHIIFYVA